MANFLQKNQTFASSNNFVNLYDAVATADPVAHTCETLIPGTSLPGFFVLIER